MGEQKQRIREHFKIRDVRRVYDKEQGKFSFNISYETTVAPTARTIAIAEAFGLGIDEARKFTVLDSQQLFSSSQAQVFG